MLQPPGAGLRLFFLRHSCLMRKKGLAHPAIDESGDSIAFDGVGQAVIIGVTLETFDRVGDSR